MTYVACSAGILVCWPGKDWLRGSISDARHRDLDALPYLKRWPTPEDDPRARPTVPRPCEYTYELCDFILSH